MPNSTPPAESLRPWVLVLDPYETVRKQCSDSIEARGYECRCAENVPQALAMIYQEKPSALLVTLRLPVMRGSALIVALGESTRHRSIPVAAIIHSEIDRRQFEAYGPAATIDVREDVGAGVNEFLDGIGLIQFEASSKGSRSSRFAPRVLLAEDSPTSQLILARMLHISGADVTVVEDGEEALAATEAEEFDIILMDIEMPNMDGMEAVGLMRDRGVTSPIIAVTGYEQDALDADAFDLDFNGHLEKPVTRQDLRDLFRTHCSDRERPAA